MENPLLQYVKFYFTQEGNTDGTTDDVEELIVEVEGLDILGDGGYIVLRTSTGWSINEREDLNYIFEQVKRVTK
jgi:hypothetical protein